VIFYIFRLCSFLCYRGVLAINYILLPIPIIIGKLDTRSIIHIDRYSNGIFIVYYSIKEDHMCVVGTGDEDGRRLGQFGAAVGGVMCSVVIQVVSWVVEEGCCGLRSRTLICSDSCTWGGTVRRRHQASRGK
jgi:hypothetical protein